MKYLLVRKVRKKLIRKSTVYEKEFRTILKDACVGIRNDKTILNYKIKIQSPCRMPGKKYAFPDFKLLLHVNNKSHVLFFEIDGEYHFSEDQIHDDSVRTLFLKNKFPGSDVYRFRNNELKDKKSVSEKILSIISSHCKNNEPLDLYKLHFNRNAQRRQTLPHGPNKFSKKAVWLMHRSADRLMNAKEAQMSIVRGEQYLMP